MKTKRLFKSTLIFVIGLFILLGGVYACSSAKEIRKPYPFRIVDSVLSKEIQATETDSIPIKVTTQFSTQDSEIISYIKYANLAGKHKLRWEWYNPTGNLYSVTPNHFIEASKGKYVEQGTAWHRISIRDTDAQYYPGIWKVKIYFDDVLASSDSFEIKIAEPTLNFGTFHALIIGNNDYHSLHKLKTAISDAMAVAQILEEDYKFDVTLLADASRSDIILAINKYRHTLTNQDNLILFYAGHGWLDKEGDEGYWLPVDAAKDNEINWISNSYITTALKAMTAKHVLIVADSCYAGKLTRGHGRSHVRLRNLEYYSRISSKKARRVLSSGGLEPVIDSGGKGDHSVFTSAFLDALKENRGIMDGTSLFNKVRHTVMLNADQIPEYSDIRKAGHDGGDFLFIRRK